MPSLQDYLRYGGDLAENVGRTAGEAQQGLSDFSLQLATGVPASLAGGLAGSAAGWGSAAKHGIRALVQGKGMAQALRDADAKGGEALVDTYRKVADALTYRPRTDVGSRASEGFGKGIERIAEHTVDPIGERSPELGTAGVVLANVIGPRSGKGKKAAPERAVEAPKEVNLPERFQGGEKEGTYRGTEAFGGITPAKLGAMRAAYLRKMEAGAPGRMWYDEASDAILRLTGEDPVKADQLANALAITSSATGVAPNTMYGVRGWNQRAVGDPIETGRFPTRMSEDMSATLADPEASASGLKRSPFSAGLSVKWRGPEFANRPTHDIHDIRAWGIIDPNTGKPWAKGVREAGHRFLDEQSQIVTDRANEQSLGGAQNWRPYRSQAAAWIAQKAAKEGVPIPEASRHYADFIPDYSAQVTREWIPGDNTSHLQELLKETKGKRREYSESMEDIVRGPQGIDALASEMGALSDRTLANRGVYENQVSPGYASQIPVGRKAGARHELDPASEKLLDAIAAAHGIVGTQKQVAWNALTGESPIKGAGAYQINRGAPFNQAELAKLHTTTKALRRGSLDIPQVDPRGARVLEFSDPGDPGRATAMDALRKAYPEAQVSAQHRQSNIFPKDENWNAPEKFSYRPLIEAVRGGGEKVVGGFDTAMKTMAPEALAKTEAWAAREGWTSAPWFATAMKGLAEGGLAKLDALQKAGIVPVAFVTGLGGVLLGGAGPGDQPGAVQ